LIETLSLPAKSRSRMSSSVRMPPPHAQRHEDHLGRPADHVEHDVAALMAGRNVKKHKLIGAFGLITARYRDRVAGIAQIDEVGAFDHPATIHIQAGNDALGKHLEISGAKRVPTRFPGRPVATTPFVRFAQSSLYADTQQGSTAGPAASKVRKQSAESGSARGSQAVGQQRQMQRLYVAGGHSRTGSSERTVSSVRRQSGSDSRNSLP